ncbi:hypothetical protein CWB80_22660, partial [Pseudoalteromonas sp. S1650]
MVELVDTRDLKSLAGNSVPVQGEARAPGLQTESALSGASIGSTEKMGRGWGGGGGGGGPGVG